MIEDPSKIIKGDLVPYFGARRYEARNNLREYASSSQILPDKESQMTKLIGLHIYGAGVLALTSSALLIGGLATIANSS